MLKSFFFTLKNAPYAWFFLALIMSLTWYGVQILVFYNAWNRELWDSIQSYDEARFWQLFLGWDWGRLGDTLRLVEDTIPSFLEILVIYVPMTVYGTWQTRRWIFRWLSLIHI